MIRNLMLGPGVGGELPAAAVIIRRILRPRGEDTRTLEHGQQASSGLEIHIRREHCRPDINVYSY